MGVDIATAAAIASAARESVSGSRIGQFVQFACVIKLCFVRSACSLLITITIEYIIE